MIITKPTRFKALSSVKILEGALLFYQCEKGKEFNLPKGKYHCEGHVKEIPFSRKETYFPEFKPLLELKPLKVTFVDNYPNKCSVWLDTGKVICDEVFSKLPSFVLTYILFHEIGHFYFRGNGKLSEIQCDTFAREKMLERGFNPSQIDLAAQITLSSSSDISQARKQISFNQLKK